MLLFQRGDARTRPHLAHTARVFLDQPPYKQSFIFDVSELNIHKDSRNTVILHTKCPLGPSLALSRHGTYVARVEDGHSVTALVLRPAAQRRWNVESAATGAALAGGGRPSSRAHSPPLRPPLYLAPVIFEPTIASQLRFLKGNWLSCPARVHACRCNGHRREQLN